MKASQFVKKLGVLLMVSPNAIPKVKGQGLIGWTFMSKNSERLLIVGRGGKGATSAGQFPFVTGWSPPKNFSPNRHFLVLKVDNVQAIIRDMREAPIVFPKSKKRKKTVAMGAAFAKHLLTSTEPVWDWKDPKTVVDLAVWLGADPLLVLAAVGEELAEIV